MSLQLAAQHLAAQGRGPDKQLVHMSPREVAGLQALAMAHGGSLSVNPKTGLPEAGFLDSILPAVVGAGLMFATGGASAAAMPGLFGLGMPATIGLGVGALQAARTGNLQKGLMAGLGAYGGAGMLGSVMGAGTGALSASAAPAQTAIPTPAMPVVPEAAGAAFTVPPPPAVTANPFTGQMIGADYAYGPQIQEGLLGQQAYANRVAEMTGSGVGLDPSMSQQAAQLRQIGGPESVKALYGEFPPPLTVTAPPSAVTAASPAAITPAPMMDPNIVSEATQERLLADKLASATPADTAKAGLRAIADKPSILFNKGNLKYGLAALSPALLAQTKYKEPELDREQYRYVYSPGRVEDPELGYTGAQTGERTYFRPAYTRLAAGGPVEAMSAANVYAMQNARGGVSDMGIDNSTGMQKMAEGGLSGYKGYGQPEENKYTYDPVKQQYGKVVPSTVALAALADAVNRLESSGGGDMGGAPAGPTSGGAYSGVTSASFDAAGMGEGSLASGGGPSGATADAAAASQANAGLDSAVDADGGAMGMARGGISDLGDYSDGGRLLKGPGDGVSDSIPAMIGRKQPARLADGEFVIPARIVSELGNGSTDAGARKLYAMMDRIQKARRQTVGKGKVAKNSKAEKYLPA